MPKYLDLIDGSARVVEQPQMHAFLVQIKRGRDVVMEFGAMGVDSVTVAHQHQCLCGPGQYVRCVATGREEPFDIKAKRQELETALLRADLAYLESSKEREARRLAEVQELERSFHSRLGWLA